MLLLQPEGYYVMLYFYVDRCHSWVELLVASFGSLHDTWYNESMQKGGIHTDQFQLWGLLSVNINNNSLLNNPHQPVEGELLMSGIRVFVRSSLAL